MSLFESSCAKRRVAIGCSGSDWMTNDELFILFVDAGRDGREREDPMVEWLMQEVEYILASS